MYDEANEDEPQDDDEKALQEALALSMMPDANEKAAEVKPAAEKEKEKQPDVDIDEDFMKDVAGDLGIDMDQSQLADIMNEAKKEKDDKDKKDADKDKK